MKLGVVLEEVDESAFWLEFIIDEQLMQPEQVDLLLDEAKEFTAMFYTSRETARERTKGLRLNKFQK